MLRLFHAVVLGLLPYLVAAQNTNVTPAVCLPGFDWSFNSLGQSPCTIASILAGACTGTNFTVGALPPGFAYTAPVGPQATSCRCSTVYFSLLSACSVCQDRNVTRWSTYKVNCPAVFDGTFMQPIPADTRVPNYAYLDVTIQDTFNATQAQAIGGPESTSIPSPTITGSTSSNPTNSNSNAAGANNTGGAKKSHAGAIAGGVVGGLVGLIVIALVIFWIMHRRRRPTPPSSTFDHTHMMAPRPMTESSSVYPSTPAPKVYDPNDPTTYPSYTGLHTPSPDPMQQHAYISPSFTGTSGQTGYPQPARPTYTGAPEI